MTQKKCTHDGCTNKRIKGRFVCDEHSEHVEAGGTDEQI